MASFSVIRLRVVPKSKTTWKIQKAPGKFPARAGITRNIHNTNTETGQRWCLALEAVGVAPELVTGPHLALQFTAPAPRILGFGAPVLGGQPDVLRHPQSPVLVLRQQRPAPSPLYTQLAKLLLNGPPVKEEPWYMNSTTLATATQSAWWPGVNTNIATLTNTKMKLQNPP